MDVRHHTLGEGGGGWGGGEGGGGQGGMGYDETFHHMPLRESPSPMLSERTPAGAKSQLTTGRSRMSPSPAKHGGGGGATHLHSTAAADKTTSSSSSSSLPSHVKTNNRQKGVKLAAFLPPVERAGHAAAVGGLVRSKDEPAKVAAARELRGLAAAFSLGGGGGGTGAGGGGSGGGALGSMGMSVGGGGGGGGGDRFLPGIIEEARKTRIASGRRGHLAPPSGRKGHPRADPDAEVKQLDWFEVRVQSSPVHPVVRHVHRSVAVQS